MCNVHDPRILNVYIAMTEEEPTDWLLLGYHDTKDVISLYSYGEHGLSEFRENIILNEILFGFIRVEEKFLLITFIPDSVNGVRRARALVHSRTVAGIFEVSHAQMTASSLSDLSDMNIRTRLKLEPGRPRSRSSVVHQQRRRRSTASYYSPSPSPIIFATTDDEDTLSERTTATPTPTFSEPFYHIITDTEDPRGLHPTDDDTTADNRFKLFQQPNMLKRIEEEQKRIKLQQKEERVLPQWQVELQQRKLQKKQNELKKVRSYQQMPREPSLLLTKTRPKSANLEQHRLPTLVEQPLPVPAKVEQPVPAKVEQPVPAKVEQPTTIKVEQPATIKVEQPTTIKVEQPATIKVEQPATIKVEQPATIKVEQPVPTKIEQKVELVSTTIEKVITKIPVTRTGFISVQVNQSPFWKRRYYTVDDNCILLYKDETCKEKMYEIRFKDTQRISLIDEDEEVYVPNSFMIETQQKELYQLLADDKKEFKSLYTFLKHCYQTIN